MASYISAVLTISGSKDQSCTTNVRGVIWSTEGEYDEHIRNLIEFFLDCDYSLHIIREWIRETFVYLQEELLCYNLKVHNFRIPFVFDYSSKIEGLHKCIYSEFSTFQADNSISELFCDPYELLDDNHPAALSPPQILHSSYYWEQR